MADAFYDANRFFGVVLNVQRPGSDQPVAVTRVNYADASDLHTGAVTWQAYAPFSLIGLWNNQGRVDRVVYGGTAAPGQTALCVDPGTQYRCVFPGIDWGEFPYTRPGQNTHTWQGTVMVDKPDAVGTYYRRNRSYDPSTARFTQEDPLGLASGLNVYGFANGDPVDFSDPFGLCDDPTDPKCLNFGRMIHAWIQQKKEAIAEWFAPSGAAVMKAVDVMDKTKYSVHGKAGPVDASFGLNGDGVHVSLSPSIGLAATVEASYITPTTPSDATQVSIGGEAGDGLVVGGHVSTVDGKPVGGAADVGVGVAFPVGGAIGKILEKFSVTLPGEKQQKQQ